jgi:hypothetical protein
MMRYCAEISGQLPTLLSRADDFGFNFDVALEVEIAPGILMGGGFSVKYPSQQHCSV